MATNHDKQEYGEAGNISLASASGLIAGDFCEIRCIGSTTFTVLTDTLEKGSAEYGNHATGTATLTGNPSVNDTLVVRGVTYTFKAEAASAVQITIGADGTETAANIAAAVDANDSLVGTSVAAVAQASGTMTFTGLPTADEVVEVNSIEYTFKAEAVLATEIAIGVDVATTAAAVAAAVAANDPLVTATSDAGVATFTAVVLGNAGNAYTLTETATNTAVSGATFTGGSDVITLTAVNGGTGGNSYTLTESAANTAVSGAGTLAGGTSLVTAQSLTYADGHILRGKFTAVHLAGGNARLTLSAPLF